MDLDRYAGAGSSIPWQRDTELLFGLPNEPKVIVSMGLGLSLLHKLRRRKSLASPSVVVLELVTSWSWMG